jgi:hypothetical protein
MSERIALRANALCLLTTLGLAVGSGGMVGCTAEAGGRGGAGPSSGGGKGDNLGESDTDATDGSGDGLDSDHRASILECEAIADHIREHVHAARVDAIVDLERDRNDCLTGANDGALGSIEAILQASGDPYAGQGLPAWKAHRTAAIAACNALVEAHPDAGSELLAGISATCIGDVEAQFGAVLDAHVDFGVAPFSIPGARDRYPTCYAAFDDETANAPGVDAVAEAAAASDTLASCIRDVHDGLVAELATRVAATFPGRDAATIEQELRDATAALAEARARVCEVAVHAGPGRASGGFLATVADCGVDVAIQAGDVLDLAAPGLLPGAPDGGDTDGGVGTDDGGEESSGGSGDTTG